MGGDGLVIIVIEMSSYIIAGSADSIDTAYVHVGVASARR